jgi:hypothetical protein
MVNAFSSQAYNPLPLNPLKKSDQWTPKLSQETSNKNAVSLTSRYLDNAAQKRLTWLKDIHSPVESFCTNGPPGRLGVLRTLRSQSSWSVFHHIICCIVKSRENINVCPYAGNIFTAKKVYIYTLKNTVFFPCAWDEFSYYLLANLRQQWL